MINKILILEIFIKVMPTRNLS